MLRVGVVGVGGWTEICHIPELQARPRASVVALCSRSPERRQAQAEHFGVPGTCGDCEERMARAEVDAIPISTPSRWHFPIARAVAAGKHVLCEKPLAMDQTEGAELLALAEERRPARGGIGPLAQRGGSRRVRDARGHGFHVVDPARFVTRGEVRAVRGASWRIGRAARPDGELPGRCAP